MSNCGSKKMKYGGSVKKMKEGGVLDKVRSAAEQSLARKSKDYKITEVGGKARKQKDFPNLSAQEMKKRQEMLARAKEIAQGMESGGEVPEKYKGFSKLPEAVQMKMDPAAARKYEGGGEVRGMGRAYQGKPRGCKIR